MIVDVFFRLIRSLEYRWLHRTKLALFSSCGTNFRFNPRSNFIDPQDMSFGDDVFINGGAHFSGKIKVGDDVMFGPNVTAFGHDHYFAIEGKKLVEIESIWRHQGVEVGSHCWIGANVTILAGVILGNGCVVAAGSVLKGTYPPFTLIAGNPGAVRKLIFDDETLKTHLLSLGYPLSYVSNIIDQRNKLTNDLIIGVVEQALPVGYSSSRVNI